MGKMLDDFSGSREPDRIFHVEINGNFILRLQIFTLRTVLIKRIRFVNRWDLYIRRSKEATSAIYRATPEARYTDANETYVTQVRLHYSRFNIICSSAGAGAKFPNSLSSRGVENCLIHCAKCTVTIATWAERSRHYSFTTKPTPCIFRPFRNQGDPCTAKVAQHQKERPTADSDYQP
jgi:hypothetical protein